MSEQNEKRYLITGAGSGMGQAIARRLHASGHRVILAGRRLEALQETLSSGALWGAGPKAEILYLPLNHNDEPAVAVFAKTCPPLDGLVLCAGELCTGSVESTSTADLDRLLGANLRGPWLMCHHLGPQLQEHASVVLVGSNIGIRPIADSAAYCVSKAGLHMLGQVLALEWAPRQIRCNVIAPGPVMTDMVQHRISQSPDPKNALKALEAVNPMGRMGELQEITALVEYLLSDASRWTTGTILPIDGGATAVM